jgi:hypothetical protein
MSAYVVAKSFVLEEMMRGGDATAQCVVQACYSAAWQEGC